jgi:hypothetical protein
VLELPDHTVLIGVDAGATEVKAHHVISLPSSPTEMLRIGSAAASCCYDRVPGFVPVALEEQLAAFERPDVERPGVEPTEIEREQGDRWVETAAGSILSVAAQARRKRAVVGIGLPGLKTEDGRGLAVVRNGPRIPDYASRLEARLAAGGLELERPIGPLSSDGDNCGRGEDADRQGLFRGVDSAYYVGGGTGVAEALKLNGRLVPFDRTRGWLKKAWELTALGGHNLEDALSTRGINAIYAVDSGRPAPIGKDEYPEERALSGDVVADGVLKEAARALAELVFERMVALRNGSPDDVLNDVDQAPYPSVILDRVVIGQRLGLLFGDRRYGRLFKDRVEEALAHRLQRSSFARLRAAHLHEGRLRPGFLRGSRLRSAPALGAAAAAVSPAIEFGVKGDGQAT